VADSLGRVETRLLRCVDFCSRRTFFSFGLGLTFFFRVFGLELTFFFRVLGLDDVDDVRLRLELVLINDDFERVFGLDFFF